MRLLSSIKVPFTKTMGVSGEKNGAPNLEPKDEDPSCKRPKTDPSCQDPKRGPLVLGNSHAQSFQKSLVEVYASNQIGIPIIV